MRRLIATAALAAFGVSASGCALLAAAGLGVMAHDEATEDDGEFDPLEDARDEVEDELED